MAKPITFTLNFLEPVSRQQFYASTYNNNRLLCSGLKYILCKFGRVYIVQITDPFGCLINYCTSMTLVVRISTKCPQFKTTLFFYGVVIFLNGCTLLLSNNSITICVLG